ncbi:MAG: AAA family ATPase, partial [Cetobacterium sp.]
PEAQQDRFLMKVKIEYPTYDEEMEILDLLTGEKEIGDIVVNTILTSLDLEKIKDEIKNVHIDVKLKQYILDIVFKTRELSDYIACGASPRASIGLVTASKGAAFLEGRDFVMPEDIKKVIYDVLRHRLILTYEAEADDKKVEDIIDDILNTVVLP